MLHQIVESALRIARERSLEQSHAACSTEWVHALAEQLKIYCKPSAPGGSVVAFNRADGKNRAEFRVNELLYDILIAETRPIHAVRGKQLQAISKALWMVESELKRSDSRDVLIDLNKLVVGKAANKLLAISSGTPLVQWAMDVMAQVLDPDEANVFLVTIPHPEHWRALPLLEGRVYQLTGGGWQVLHRADQS